MSKIIRPTNKVTVFDPETGNREAATTDTEEMGRRQRKEVADLKAQVKIDKTTPISVTAAPKAKNPKVK